MYTHALKIASTVYGTPLAFFCGKFPRPFIKKLPVIWMDQKIKNEKIEPLGVDHFEKMFKGLGYPNKAKIVFVYTNTLLANLQNVYTFALLAKM